MKVGEVMAKETQKEIVARLEKEVQELKEKSIEKDNIITRLDKEVIGVQEKANEGFYNSSEYKSMSSELKVANATINVLKAQIEHTEKKQKIKLHNERGAGRKSLFTDKEKSEIQMYRFQGKTLKEISELYECSIGLIHKLLNE